MNAYEMFYNPSKSVLQMMQMIANSVANLMNVARMKRGHKTWELICIIHIVGVCHCLISARPCSISLLFFKFVLIVIIRRALYGMSIRMPANLYKRLTTTTSALTFIRMACDCLRIYCEYAFLANFRSIF